MITLPYFPLCLRVVLVFGALASVRCSPSDGSRDASSALADATADAADSGVGDEAPPTVTPLLAQSGFIEVGPDPTTFRGSGRMFYSFQPAESADGGPKPLIVFFNGGPGAATSTLLTAFGTGRYSLPRREIPGTHVVPNPNTFARFANLLYVDARNTGFSYELRPDDGKGLGSCDDFIAEDAADMVRVILRFLTANPAIRRAPVVIAGESYGGIRTVTMLRQLFHYRDPSLPVPNDLRDEMQAHFDAVWPGGAGTVHPTAQIATQFVGAILIQPLLGGQEQNAITGPLVRLDPYLSPYLDTPNARHDVRESVTWSNETSKRAAAALADEEASRSLLQFDLGRIEALLAPARRNAWRNGNAVDSDIEARFGARFGLLGADDQYLSFQFPGTAYLECTIPATLDDRIFRWFLDLLPEARFFLTNARYDSVIHSPAIVAMLKTANGSTVVDDAARPNVERPGWIKMSVPAAEGGDKDVAIRYPLYDDSGHAVTIAQGAELANDVRDWLSER
ncbi:MAG: hypothetical protein ABW133_12485 [Polyangiaceae bacterium]